MLCFLFLISITIFTSCGNDVNYTGEKKDGQPHGYGIRTYSNGTVYEGEFEAGLRSGEGTWTNPEGTTYSGQWQNDLCHGQGALKISGTLFYKGAWEAGKREGYGIQTWNDGRQYEGTWHADRRHGEGVMYYPDGSYYAGQWSEGKKHGSGTLYQAGKVIKEGEWIEDVFQYTPVTTVALGTDQLVLQEDTPSYKLEAIVLPHDATDPTLVWESSDPEIVSVEEGELTPHKTGEAVITVTAIAEDISETCLVTIIPGLVRPSGINLNENEILLRTNNDPVTLYATVEPADAVNKEVTWSSSNPDVATVNQFGTITPLSPGETIITAQTMDGGYYDQCEINVWQSLFDSNNSIGEDNTGDNDNADNNAPEDDEPGEDNDEESEEENENIDENNDNDTADQDEPAGEE